MQRLYARILLMRYATINRELNIGKLAIIGLMGDVNFRNLDSRDDTSPHIRTTPSAGVGHEFQADGKVAVLHQPVISLDVQSSL